MQTPLAAFVVLGLAVGMPAYAQTARPERPYRGMFGGGEPTAEGQTLTANTSIGAGYDDNILLDQPIRAGSRNPGTATKGTLGSFTGSLSYQENSQRFDLGAVLGMSSRYYPGQDRRYVTGYNGHVTLSAELGARSHLTASQTAGYAPFTLASLFPVPVEAGIGDFDAPPLDMATSDRSYLTRTSSLEFRQNLTSRVTFSAGYGYLNRSTALYGGPFTMHNGGAGLSFEVGRGLSLNLGYRRRLGLYPRTDRRVSVDTIDAGVNYRRALSFSRRTTLQFGTGTAVLETGDRTRYRATGNATLNHEMGRTWLASLAYGRSVQLVETLLVPVLHDAVTGTVGGTLSRRLQVNSNFRASIGKIGVTDRDTGYDTYQAGGGVTYTLTRYMNLGANYSFFRYRFGADTALPPGVSSSLDRQSVRVQVSLWAPLID